MPHNKHDFNPDQPLGKLVLTREKPKHKYTKWEYVETRVMGPKEHYDLYFRKNLTTGKWEAKLKKI